MPISLSYDIEAALPVQHNHIQSMFQRFWWDNVGGSAYQYPGQGIMMAIQQGQLPLGFEDWLNHVIPALMMFRVYVHGQGLSLTRFSLSTQSMVAATERSPFPPVIQSGQQILLARPGNVQFGEKILRSWLDSIEMPYAQPPRLLAPPDRSFE